MSNTCPRCLKTNVDIHTCTPTDFVRKIESDRDAALAIVRELVNWCRNIESDPMITLRVQQVWQFRELATKAEALNG